MGKRVKRNRKKIWGANKRRKRGRLSKKQLEKMSKRNAYKIMTGTDSLQSWGKTGWYKSKKLDEWFHYRSSIELTTIKFIDRSDYIKDFDTECFAIPYQWKGVECNYIPDIILKTEKGNVFVVEVKPKDKLDNVRNKAKWAEAKRWCWKNGCKFLVITEKDNLNLIKILKLLEDKDSEKAQELLEWSMIS